MTLPLNTIICGDCLDVMKTFEDKSVDLTVTSPPYDNLREYRGYVFNFEETAKQLCRVTKDGGVVVWVVGDATINGSETGTSFKQALYFKEIGFNLHDTMIYHKNNPVPNSQNRYQQCFEYMFIFSKGTPKSVNLITRDLSESTKKRAKYKTNSGFRTKGGGFENRVSYAVNDPPRFNIWEYTIGTGNSTTDDIAFQHPAIFPEQLANDHIRSWSNECDTVLDPFSGSGTTAKMANINQRNYIGIDISQEYCDIAKKRLEKVNNHKIEEWF